MIIIVNSIRVLLWFMVIIFPTMKSYSQVTSSPLGSMETYFDQITGIENAGVINGRQYRMGQLGAKSNPFFDKGEVLGMVEYHGNRHSVPLLYDISKDELVLKHISAQGLAWFVQLQKNAVSEFYIWDRRFRRFDRGFHEVIFDESELMILAKRSKVGKTEKGIFNYLNDDNYFVVHSGVWSPLRNSSGVLRLLQDKEQKKKVKSFIQKNGIRIRRFEHDELALLGNFLVDVLKEKRP